MYLHYCRWKCRLYQIVVVVATAYVTLCIAAVITLFPSEPIVEHHSNENNQPNAHVLYGDVWHGLPKRGGRPRNIFSSEGHEDFAQNSKVESIASVHRVYHRETSNNSRRIGDKLPVNDPSNVMNLENNFRPTELSDIFIGVKTTEQYHYSRLPVLFETWLDNPSVRKQTYFFTDANDSKYYTETNGQFINTHCANRHTREGLCCKMGVILSTYLKSGKRWWCNVDDDNYLNVDNLLKLLQSYRHDKDHYFGRSSTSAEITVYDNGGKTKLNKVAFANDYHTRRQARFWFATGGAGVCISWSLALKMSPYAGKGEFRHVCDRINLPDDVSIGFLIVDLLGVPLTKLKDLHSHLTRLQNLRETQISRAITLSYQIKTKKASNHILLNDAAFNTTEDPTRLKSLHCKLHPEAVICPKALAGDY